MARKVATRDVPRRAWALRRFDTDFHLVQPMQLFARRSHHSTRFKSRSQQWIATVVVVIAGFPSTQFNYHWEEFLTRTT